MQKVSRVVLGLMIFFFGTTNGVFLRAATEVQATVAAVQDLPPSPLEAFATRATANVIWTKPIGRIDSDDARATVTALTVEDAGAQPSVRRGVRINLKHLVTTPHCDWKYTAWRVMCERPNAAVYIEAERLVKVRDSLDRHNVAELRPREFISLFNSTSKSGMILCGYQFTGHEPRELAKLLTNAITELNNAR
ncbi:MAG TPA: hypothetical protein VFZ34_34160 [Blastocatellia bacterium]|nr:hypothetical protein [Blastocatellia bacterium]